MANLIDIPALDNASTPWRSLLVVAEKNASLISTELINDAVLGKSVTAAVSSYFSQADAMTFLREEFAAADLACRDVRAKAASVMRAFGLAQDWDQDDLKVADEELWVTLRHVTENASTTNRKRSEAKLLEREVLDKAIDEIDTCTGIVALRHRGEFKCDGDAFCAAYIAALSTADGMIGNAIKITGVKILSEFLQYSMGVKVGYRDYDIYAESKTAARIGLTIGIENANSLRAALIVAIKKNSPRL
jgi:hypothetical protein